MTVLPDLGQHVGRMLAIARDHHHEFEEDCLTDPGLLVEHWGRGGDLRIAYVDALDHGIGQDPTTVIDDAGTSDLSGLFTPALPPKRFNRIQVKYREYEYTARRNFTLLHEIGHYLQQTDDELVDAMCRFPSTYKEKRFEEAACNRFASLALLPDDHIRSFLHAPTLHAADIRDIFEHGRPRGRREGRKVRVSRPVVVRRMADFISVGQTVSLIKNGKLEVRVHGDGTIDYDDALTDIERHVAINYKPKGPRREMLQRVRRKDGSTVRFTAAGSYGRDVYYFVVLRH
ncbi:ImmA/IrrE family metallo-endopeptidase [Bifidobacterium callimiconis]|uniref:IrrE N-terminal-like domain-containing protein n=1 Tax=Bifidobacterium callimiconis TaxID=2306973 RepID=A0A430FGM8_9BIFI|nr:ImmA/IrrE family metallo-endopeptidase [Bifidobacterium callimiconis]RSX52024.1 hypothetical protein D2E23_0631 [Bifidobacterium callimiconis]